MLDDRSAVTMAGEAEPDTPPAAGFSSRDLDAVVTVALGPSWTPRASLRGRTCFHHEDGTRITVRASVAKRSWATSKPCGAKWDIAPSGHLLDGLDDGAVDILVLGHHPVWPNGSESRDPAQWRFFVVAERTLPCREAVSLPAITALAQSVARSDLLGAVERLRRAFHPASPGHRGATSARGGRSTNALDI